MATGRKKNKLAFTLVELVVVIAIIGVLAAFLIPSVAGYIKNAKVEALNNNARTVYLAMQNYLTDWVADGNTAGDIGSDGTVNLEAIIPAVPAQELTENSENIRYLTMNRNNADKKSTTLYRLLSNYISDQALLEKSILIEYNAVTGKVRAAFVSETAFLGYSGNAQDASNVLDRQTSALFQKEQGYYGIDYTGVNPQKPQEQELAVRIINENNILKVECDLADLAASEGMEYEFHVYSAENPQLGYQIVLNPNLTDPTNPQAVVYNSAKTAIDHADASRPMTYLEAGTGGSGKIVLILDAFCKWNAYDSTKKVSMAERYPNLPVGLLDAEVTAKEASTGTAAGEAVKSENFAFSYFAGREWSDAQGGYVYLLSDARHINNIRYLTDPENGGAVTASFRQTQNVSMRAFFDTIGDKSAAQGEKVTISPLGVFAGAYTARVSEEGQDNFSITDLSVATAAENAGLFGMNKGTISRVTVAGAQVGAENTPVSKNSGILAGTNAQGGVIKDCRVCGSVSGDTAAGGIAGVNNGVIMGCAGGSLPDSAGARDHLTDIGYTYHNTYYYTEKILEDGVVKEVPREMPCVISSGKNGEKNAAVGGIAGKNTNIISQCVNISQIQNTAAEGYAGGLIGWNETGDLNTSYNAGRVTATGSGSSVGGVCGKNGGASVRSCYNTGRVNLTADEDNSPDNYVSLSGGNIGGVIGYDEESGVVTDCYAINYIGVDPLVQDTAAGGIVGRDETVDPEAITNCSFIPGNGGVKDAAGESVLGARVSLRTIYEPSDLAGFYTGGEWETDTAPPKGTFFYVYPYLAGTPGTQQTPWEEIIPAAPELEIRLVNSTLLTAEWPDSDVSVTSGVSVEFLDANGQMLDRIDGIDLSALRSITTAEDAVAQPLTSIYGNQYPAYCENGIFKIILDGVMMDGTANRIDNYFRNWQEISAGVVYPGGTEAYSNRENTMYAGTDAAGNALVANARHLYNVRYDLLRSFVQTADIAMLNYDGSVCTIAPLGTLGGRYNGAGYSVESLAVLSQSGDAGLFAEISEDAAVSNLEIVSGSITGSGNLGAVAAINRGSIAGCTVRTGVSFDLVSGSSGIQKNIGGIAGWNTGISATQDDSQKYPVTPGDNYIHTQDATFQKGTSTATVIFRSGDDITTGWFSNLYISFHSLNTDELGIPKTWKNRLHRVYVTVQINGTDYNLYRGLGQRLSIQDLIDLGQKVQDGYYCSFYSIIFGLYYLSDVTDIPGYVTYSGEITDCVNEASIALPQGQSGQDDRIGGIAGQNDSIIARCISGTMRQAPGMTTQEAVDNPTTYTSEKGTVLGGVAGANAGEIQNCINIAKVESIAEYGAVGGIAGYNNNSVTLSYNAGSVVAAGDNSNVGGVTGYNKEAVTNCYNTGRVNVDVNTEEVTMNDGNIGGITGRNGSNAQVGFCYNIGYIGNSSGGYAGGVIGQNYNFSTSGKIVQNVFTLKQGRWNQNVIGYGTVQGVSNSSLTAAGLISANLGSQFSADPQPIEQTYYYPYPYLRGSFASQQTPWEDTSYAQYGLLGMGTEEEPFQIATSSDLAQLDAVAAAMPDACFIQTADIDMTGISYAPVAVLNGKYDGNGHTIANLNVAVSPVWQDGAEYYAGGMTADARGGIANLCLLNPVITVTAPSGVQQSRLYAGILAGNTSGTIENCMTIGGSIHITGTSDSADLYLGGIVGRQSAAQVVSCASLANLSAEGNAANVYLGGITGYAAGDSIDNCYFAGSLQTVGDFASYPGGIAGYNGGAISACVILQGSADSAVGAGTMVNADVYSEERLSGDEALDLLGSAWRFHKDTGFPYPLCMDLHQFVAGIWRVEDTQPTPSASESETASPSPTAQASEGVPFTASPQSSETVATEPGGGLDEG
ncbi:MAG: type II secretion system protein [Christensenella sp.]|nr:type II secretion system protein [Christensenella sp.]